MLDDLLLVEFPGVWSGADGVGLIAHGDPKVECHYTEPSCSPEAPRNMRGGKEGLAG